MARRKREEVKDEPAIAEQMYELQNLTQSVIPVQYYTAEGRMSYMHLRIQGRGGEPRPVIHSYSVTDHMRTLVRKGLIKLNKV